MKTLRYFYFFALALTLISCSDSGTNPDSTFHDISVSVAPDGAGTIAPSADSSYETGSTINLQANQSDGYQFTSWTGDLDTTANPLSLTVDRDYTLTANFIPTDEVFYLHENGVTIMCQDALPGQKGMVNGTEYVAVDRQKLFQKIYSEGNLNVCTSPVHNMASLFRENRSFDQDISNWDVSNVTNMRSMFNGATSFNRDISKWNVGNVTDMSHMFYSYWGSSSFNADLNNWNVSKVTDMSSMFEAATSFNSDLSSWDVSNVADMSEMFDGATNFRGDISNWDVSNVTNMSGMFIDTELGVELLHFGRHPVKV
jgi:uncharacterized repeat protein (TIGR02543 family)